ncbi:hypothetical protein EMIT0P258_50014 [Pseudomonas sp. IT-P258]
MAISDAFHRFVTHIRNDNVTVLKTLALLGNITSSTSKERRIFTKDLC